MAAATIITIIGFLASAAYTGVSVGTTLLREHRQDLLRSEAYKTASTIYKQLDSAGVIDSIINSILNSDTTVTPGAITNAIYASPSAMNLINSYNAKVYKIKASKSSKASSYQSSSTELSSKIKEIDSQLTAISNQINTLASFASGKRKDTEAKQAEIDKLNTEVSRLTKLRSDYVHQLNELGQSYKSDIGQLNEQATSLRSGLSNLNSVKVRQGAVGTAVSNVMQVPSSNGTAVGLNATNSNAVTNGGKQ